MFLCGCCLSSHYTSGTAILLVLSEYARYPSGKWIQEWRKNEIKSVQHVQLRNYMIIESTTHDMKYLHIMQYTWYTC